jgi:hypothetical protein
VSKSSNLLHLDPLAIALEKKRVREQETTESSRSNMSSQLSEQPGGGPVSNQPILSKQSNMGSQPILDNHSLNILASTPEIKGDSKLPHRYTDHLCRLLKPDEQAVFLQLYRLSWGWAKETCFISNPRLSERSNVPLSSMKRAVAGLIAKGMIEKTGQSNGYGKEQGVEYRLPNMDWQSNMSRQPTLSSQPNMSPIKEKLLKENNKRETAAAPDYKTCPDCQGSGFWYPEGVEKGVAKCRHVRMPVNNTFG